MSAPGAFFLIDSIACMAEAFAWVRGETHLVVVNPRAEPVEWASEEVEGMEVVWGSGVRVWRSELWVDGFGYAVLAPGG